MATTEDQKPSGQQHDDAGAPANTGVSAPAPAEGADDAPGPDAGSPAG